MGFNVVQKLIAAHLVEGDPSPGKAVSIRVIQTLAHDVTGPRVLEHFQQLGADRIKCDLSIFYVDHDLAPLTQEAVDSAATMREAARRAGAHFSRPGNGLGLLVHLERFAVPGRTLVGAGAHTQILGAAGMLALSGEALEVAAVMAGEPLEVTAPEVVRVVLLGKPRPFVSPKDIALELLRRRGPGGLAGKAIEIDGPGARTLGVYERATVAAMGPALGAMTTMFPSDEKTRIFLQRQRRSKSWRRIEADTDATYQGEEVVDLGALEPLALVGGDSPEVRPVRELGGRPVHEVLLGSCANGSARDILTVAAMLRGKKVHPECTFAIAPGTRQALEVLAREGTGEGGKALADLISAGVRILENGCGPCLARHRLPAGSISVRTFAHPSQRNDEVEVVVVSPETAAACAIHGEITDPRKLRRPPRVKLPRQLPVDDSMIVRPGRERARRAGSTKPSQPPGEAIELEDALRAEVVRRLGHGARLEPVEADEVTRPVAQARGKTTRARCLIAGRDLGFDFLETEVASAHRRSGIRVVVAESFAPPCEVSLANAGVVPLRFLEAGTYDRVRAGDELVIRSLARNVRSGEPIPVSVTRSGTEFQVACDLGERGREILVAGGLLAYLTRPQRPSTAPPR